MTEQHSCSSLMRRRAERGAGRRKREAGGGGRGERLLRPQPPPYYQQRRRRWLLNPGGHSWLLKGEEKEEREEGKGRKERGEVSFDFTMIYCTLSSFCWCLCWFRFRYLSTLPSAYTTCPPPRIISLLNSNFLGQLAMMVARAIVRSRCCC